MRRIFYLLLYLFAVCGLRADSWVDDFSSIDKTRWEVFGKYFIESDHGLLLGSSDDTYGSSGVRTQSPVGKLGKSVQVTAEFENFKVTTPAPREGTNQTYPVDISLNFQLSAEPEKLFFDSDVAAVLVTVCYNAENDTLVVAVRGKSANRANEFGDNITATFLKDKAPAGKTKYRLILEAGGTSVNVTLFADGVAVWNWMGNGSGSLDDKIYLKIYQQNILTGHGTVNLKKVAVESAE